MSDSPGPFNPDIVYPTDDPIPDTTRPGFWEPEPGEDTVNPPSGPVRH